MPKRTSDTGKGPFVRRSETRPQPSVVANKSAATHDEFAKVWVKNQTGSNRSVFDVVKLGDSTVDPTTSDDHERAFWSRVSFDAEEVDEDGISNVAILTAPVQSGNSQKALATGVSVVKLTGSTGKTRATTKSGEYTLEASDSGPFEILHDPGPTGEERYAYVRFGGAGGCISIICRPRRDVDTGDVMVCDIQEGPIFAETDTGETLIGINTGSLIAADTRCEAVHYSCRKGGEPHLLTGPEVSSFLSSAALSDGVSSTTADQYANYELFPLNC